MNEITTTPAKTAFSLTPTTLAEAMQFAQMLAKSSLVPKDYQGNPSNCIIAMQWGQEIGLQPLQAMQSIAVINGRPSIWGDAMLALVRGSGLLEYIREEPTDAGCTCTIKRRGEPEAVRTFTVEDAKKAGLFGKQGPWQQHPKRMLQMRARAFALRDVFTDVLRGVHIAEEAQDIPAEKDMGPVDEVKPLALPASRAERARTAIDKRKAAAPAADVPALAAVLDAINTAADADSLHAAASLATGLPPEDKASARAAWADRKETLMAKQVETVDQDTGEVTDQPVEAMAERDEFLAGLEG